jgi:hypothetical protein
MSSPRKTVLGIAAAILVLAASGGWLWFRFAPRRSLEQTAFEVLTRGPSDRDAERMVELNNLGLAALENGDLPTADRDFLEIATTQRGDPVGPRNLLITRLLAASQLNDEKQPKEFIDAVDRARTTLTMEWAAERNEAVRGYLAAKSAGLADNKNAAISYLHFTAGHAAQDPSILYELNRAVRDAADAPLRGEGELALQKACEFRPENLFLLLRWLELQAQRRDVAIDQTLERAQHLFQLFPTEKRFLTENRGESAAGALRSIADARSAAKKGDWPGVTAAVSAISKAGENLAAVRADERRIEPNILRFVLPYFFARFYDEHHFSREWAANHIDVRFQELPVAGPLAEVTDVRDARFVDFELDGTPAIGVLRRSSFEVY